MKNILILDLETTGTDPSSDAVVEVAAVLYSVEHAVCLAAVASLIHGDGNAAEAINRIPAAALVDAPDATTAWAPVFALAEEAGAIVAHQAEFDHAFSPPLLRERSWICSMSDLQWPRQSKPRPSLVALALEHDLGVAVAHRAMADCELLARLFTRARELGADLDAMLARGLRPKGEFIALVSFEEREKAKQAGFGWDAAQRQWRRRMAIEDAAQLPFRVRAVAA